MENGYKEESHILLNGAFTYPCKHGTYFFFLLVLLFNIPHTEIKKSLKYKSYLSARSVILRIFAIIEIFESWVTSYTKFRAYVFLYCTIHCSKRCLKCQNQSQTSVQNVRFDCWLGSIQCPTNSWGNVMGGMHSTFFLIEVGSGNWGALTLKGGTGLSGSQDPLFTPIQPFFRPQLQYHSVL